MDSVYVCMGVLLLLGAVTGRPNHKQQRVEVHHSHREGSIARRRHDSAQSERRYGNGNNKLFVCPAFLVPDRVAAQKAMFMHAEEWKTVLELITSSDGGYHFHEYQLFNLAIEDAQSFAQFFKARPNITVSIEVGGYLCDGQKSAQNALQNLQNYTSAGGRIDQWALESIFSRTMRGCAGKIKTFQQVADQAALYVQELKKAMPHVQFGVIDAVPHFSAGKYPASNQTRTNLGDIRDALSTLNKTLAGIGTKLQFYWADCPYEYSAAFAGNVGYEKLEFIANYTTNELGIRMGKIFNSEKGGETSSKMFYDRSLEDYHRYIATGNSAAYTSDVIAESWYKFPADVIPETDPYTFMYTAKAILQAAADHTPPRYNRQMFRKGHQL